MGNPLNLILGPASLYIGTFGVPAEPSTSADFSGSTWTAPSGWTDLGYTNGGVTLNLTKEYTNLEVDQLTMSPHGVVTSEACSITTSMAEANLENLVLAMNDGDVTTAGGVKSYEPVDALAGRGTSYKTVLMVGTGVSTDPALPATRRFVILRKVLSTEGLSLAMSKTDQTVLEVTFTGYYVSDSIRPYKILDKA